MDEEETDEGYSDKTEEEEEWKAHQESEADLRAKFPHLALHITPRESDESH